MGPLKKRLTLDHHQAHFILSTLIEEEKNSPLRPDEKRTIKTLKSKLYWILNIRPQH